ncbi:MAG: hypothetical protein ACI4ON_01925 [Clostridia bacterium]
MNYFVIILAIISIILVFLSRFYELSIVYPTLIIILTIFIDVLVNTIKNRKKNKENINIKEKELK